MVNWKVRLKSKEFWVGLVGAIGVCVVSLAQAFGFDVDVTGWESAANSIITGVFTVLALVGVVTDPTTQGIGDSEQALTYTSPKSKDTEQAETTATAS